MGDRRRLDCSLVLGHWYLVIGTWSLVLGHWCLVIGAFSFDAKKPGIGVQKPAWFYGLGRFFRPSVWLAGEFLARFANQS
jgi:hypothetical protein